MKQYAPQGKSAKIVVSLEDIKVLDLTSSRIAMVHPLKRVCMCSGDAPNSMFGFVAKNPTNENNYCHVFHMKKPRHTEEIRAVVGKAFKLAFHENRIKTMEKNAGQNPSRSSPAAGATAQDAGQRVPAAARSPAAPGSPSSVHVNLSSKAVVVSKTMAPLVIPAVPSPVEVSSPNLGRRPTLDKETASKDGHEHETAVWYQAGEHELLFGVLLRSNVATMHTCSLCQLFLAKLQLNS
eukprot:m.336648 g.336648  ORF g.336648 m.336648 type:complete len:237 (+) comp55703_c0_seq8:1528-2238(+)